MRRNSVHFNKLLFSKHVTDFAKSQTLNFKLHPNRCFLCSCCS